MILDKNIVESQINKLGFPKNIVSLCKGMPVHDKLKVYCGEVYDVYKLDVTPLGQDIIPLWQSGDQITACWHKKGNVEYFTFYVDMPDKYEIVGYSIYSVIALIIADLWTSEVPNKTLYEIADLLDFKDMRTLIQNLEKENTKGFKDQEIWLKQYCLSMKGPI